MKQTTKYILALLVMILSTTSIMAGGNGTYIYKIEGAGAGSENPGTVKYEGGGVITVTPTNGFYLTVADLTVIKTLDGTEILWYSHRSNHGLHPEGHGPPCRTNHSLANHLDRCTT